jgi:hypothetical protein
VLPSVVFPSRPSSPSPPSAPDIPHHETSTAMKHEVADTSGVLDTTATQGDFESTPWPDTMALFAFTVPVPFVNVRDQDFSLFDVVAPPHGPRLSDMTSEAHSLEGRGVPWQALRPLPGCSHFFLTAMLTAFRLCTRRC